MDRAKISEEVQRFGRSLLLPIAVMAPVGMILGIVNALTQAYLVSKVPLLGNPAIKLFLTSVKDSMSIIFSNIPILFAMGVAYGVSRKEKGISVFSSVISYIVLLAGSNVYLKITGTLIKEKELMDKAGQAMVLGIQTVRMDVFGGIISGLIAAKLTDRFYKTELPVAFAFFSGKKLVPILSIFVTSVASFIATPLWMYFTKVLAGMSVILLHPLGPFVNIIMVRLLIPFGLHHTWSALLRFTEAGGVYQIAGKTYVGVLPAANEIIFNLGPNSPEWQMMPKLTRFLAQNQMIDTLFMFPGIAFAMYKTAYKKNKPLVKGILITMVLTAFLGNITEPLEFSFLFISPVLYLMYILIGAASSLALAFMGTAVGYIRGTIFDFIIFGVMYENSKFYNVIIVGVVAMFVSYFTFKWYILKRNLITPGREEEVSDSKLLVEKRYKEIAKIVVEALGGKENIVNVENCISRLRIDLKDKNIINKERLKESGTLGIFFPSKNQIHIVFGPHVEFVRNEVDELL